jgi:hypothetical protein
VEQQNRNAVRIALFDVRQLDSIPKHRQMNHAQMLSGVANRRCAPTAGRDLLLVDFA